MPPSNPRDAGIIRYPLYIGSKGRADYPHRTSVALHEMGVPHYLVVEEQERAECERTVAPAIEAVGRGERVPVSVERWQIVAGTLPPDPAHPPLA
jgi:hypothetical protein